MNEDLATILIVGGILIIIGVVLVYDRYLGQSRDEIVRLKEELQILHQRTYNRGWDKGFLVGRQLGTAEGKKIGRQRDPKTGKWTSK